MKHLRIGLGLKVGRVAATTPQRPPPHGWRAVPVYGACYSCYAVVLALEFGVFVAWRWALLGMLAVVMRESEWSSFVYMVGTVLLGLGLFILAMAAEPYLHTGVRRHQLVRRFARLAVPLASAGIAGMLLSTLITAFLL